MKHTLFILGICLVSCMADNWSDNPNKRQEPVNIPYFKDGQILLPDYACADTLVVLDANGLNKAMGYIEQGIVDGTDGDIDSILHIYCRVK